jgi:hypothetical protein
MCYALVEQSKKQQQKSIAIVFRFAVVLRETCVLNGAPAPNPGRCFALFYSLPAAPTAQTGALCAVFKCITRSVSAFNPQIVRVSAIHPCIAQAAPELLASPVRVSPASRPWPHATGIHARCAQRPQRLTSLVGGSGVAVPERSLC